MLVCFLHYGEIVWLWNLLIIILIWILYKNNVKASLQLQKKYLVIVVFLILAPFLQIFTTLAYPLSYRMYTGSEVQLIIDGQSYAASYYNKTRAIPYLSKETFQTTLKRKCVSSGFETAELSIPKLLWRKQQTMSFSCTNGTLIQK